MTYKARQCEVSDKINDGPWVRCPREGRPVMSWNGELGDIEEEILCEEHERLMYESEEDDAEA